MDQLSVNNSPGLNPEVMYKLGSIEAQLAAINEKLDKKEVEQDVAIGKLKTEVGKLKEFRAIQLGAAGVISFVIGILTRIIPWSNLL